MIEASLYFIEAVNKEFGIKPKRVLDVGSMDRNKEIGARELFPDSEYIGVDMQDGPNVDFVMDAYSIAHGIDENSFDAVLCLHLLEHIARPWLVLEQIAYILKDRGYLYVSIPTIGFPVHKYPGDYWRATEQAVREVIMDGYEVLCLEHAKSTFHKHPFINALGRKNA